MALVWLWYGFGVALVWLCTPESMPSICLLYGFAVALGGLRPFLVQGSKFDVRRSASAPGGLKVLHGECPVRLRCRDEGIAMRHGLHRLAGREAAQRWQGGSPRLRANPWHLCLEAVRWRSGVGPGVVPCGSRKVLTARRSE